MIKQKYLEVFKKYYYDGTPKQKAILDMLGMLVGAVLGGLIVSLIVANGLWGELAFCFLIYAFYGLFKTFYEARVFHHKIQEQLNKKG